MQYDRASFRPRVTCDGASQNLNPGRVGSPIGQRHGFFGSHAASLPTVPAGLGLVTLARNGFGAGLWRGIVMRGSAPPYSPILFHLEIIEFLDFWIPSSASFIAIFAAL